MDNSKKIAALLIIIIPMLLSGCGNHGTEPPPPPDPAKLTKQGWDYFVVENYEKALEMFKSALDADDSYAPAYCGLGWTYIKIGNALASSDENFLKAITLDPDLTDAYAGLCLVSLALGKFEEALEYSETVSNKKEKCYQFPYDDTLTWFEIYMVRVQSLFYLGEFESSYKVIRDEIYPEAQYPPAQYPQLVLDTRSPFFPAELLMLIEILNNGGLGI